MCKRVTVNICEMQRQLKLDSYIQTRKAKPQVCVAGQWNHYPEDGVNISTKALAS